MYIRKCIGERHLNGSAIVPLVRIPQLSLLRFLEALRDKEPSHLCITNIDKGSDVVVDDYAEVAT
jgi:hypothetical protein